MKFNDFKTAKWLKGTCAFWNSFVYFTFNGMSILIDKSEEIDWLIDWF